MRHRAAAGGRLGGEGAMRLDGSMDRSRGVVTGRGSGLLRSVSGMRGFRRGGRHPGCHRALAR